VKIGAPFIPPSLAAAGGDSLVLRGDPLLLEKLTLGQIIKGRVLRSYEGQRYLMHFEGQERIVDSAVPLRTGDILHGRVIGLGERIELQRVAVQPDDAPSQDDAAEPARPRADLADPSLRFVADLFARHHDRLDAEARARPRLRAGGNRTRNRDGRHARRRKQGTPSIAARASADGRTGKPPA
jgi:hypothetical protein